MAFLAGAGAGGEILAGAGAGDFSKKYEWNLLNFKNLLCFCAEYHNSPLQYFKFDVVYKEVVNLYN